MNNGITKLITIVCSTQLLFALGCNIAYSAIATCTRIPLFHFCIFLFLILSSCGKIEPKVLECVTASCGDTTLQTPPLPTPAPPGRDPLSKWPIPAWPEDGIHVAINRGTNNDSCGSESTPCRTLKYAHDKLPEDGNAYTVYVHPGTYNLHLETLRWVGIEMRSNTRFLGVGGPEVTKVYSRHNVAFRMIGTTNTLFEKGEIDGLEIYGDWNQGKGANALIRLYNAQNIVIRNSIIHDAPCDADGIKGSGYLENILLDHLIVYNPGYSQSDEGEGCYPLASKADDFEENIDFSGTLEPKNGVPPIRNVVVRNSWLFQTPEKQGDAIIYGKNDVENFVIENNIIGPSMGNEFGDGGGQGDGSPALVIGVGSRSVYSRGTTHSHTIVRNNIFVSCQGDGVMGITNADDIWVYNNIFHNNGGRYLRSVIQLAGNQFQVRNINLFNNVFQNNHPARGGAGSFYRLRDDVDIPSISKSNNLYYNNIDYSPDLAYTGETGSLYPSSPAITANLPVPFIPARTPTLNDIALRKAAFSIQDESLTRGRGINPIEMDGHPNWLPDLTNLNWDTFGKPRPSWSLGPFR